MSLSNFILFVICPQIGIFLLVNRQPIWELIKPIKNNKDLVEENKP